MSSTDQTKDDLAAATETGAFGSAASGSEGVAGSAGTGSAGSEGRAAEGSDQLPSESAASAASASFSADGASAVPSALAAKTGYEKFDAFELAIVLSHFNIGVIHKIKEFPRGSRKAPKLILKSDKGPFLLKRRARGKDDPFKVAFCHQLQGYLASKQFPLPHLIGTVTDNNSMLQFNGRLYELFEYIKGTSYESSPAQTADSGRLLAIFHKLLQQFKSDYTPPTGSYHASRYVTAALDRIPATLAKVGETRSDSVTQIVQTLFGAYSAAQVRVNDAGIADWPTQIVHGDWHPGNMLYRADRVVAVIDYDAARIQTRILDVANGAMQFSIVGGGSDPNAWPHAIDEGRFKKFLHAYDEVPGCQLTRAELRIIPWLMIEAIVAESAIPIANTGQFARMPGLQFLTMVERKIRWIQANADRLARVLEG